ncbi:hypothetical protein LTR85_003438 [Meristemomyces frigidus]|nr:hypothetical protein LTR85_003438 [Meristemomyces frigidus]
MCRYERYWWSCGHYEAASCVADISSHMSHESGQSPLGEYTILDEKCRNCLDIIQRRRSSGTWFMRRWDDTISGQEWRERQEYFKTRWVMTEEERAQDEKDGIPRSPTQESKPSEPQRDGGGEPGDVAGKMPEEEAAKTAEDEAFDASYLEYAESLQCEHGNSLWTCDECYEDLRTAANENDRNAR